MRHFSHTSVTHPEFSRKHIVYKMFSLKNADMIRSGKQLNLFWAFRRRIWLLRHCDRYKGIRLAVDVQNRGSHLTNRPGR